MPKHHTTKTHGKNALTALRLRTKHAVHTITCMTKKQCSC